MPEMLVIALAGAAAVVTSVQVPPTTWNSFVPLTQKSFADAPPITFAIPPAGRCDDSSTHVAPSQCRTDGPPTTQTSLLANPCSAFRPTSAPVGIAVHVAPSQ